MWPMGFFALFAIMGLPMILEGEWIGAVWFVWLLWLLYFIPQKEDQS